MIFCFIVGHKFISLIATTFYLLCFLTEAPGSPSITLKIEATSVTVTWLKPTDVGGSPITAYRVLVLQDSTEIENRNITQLLPTEIFIGGLNKSTNYTVRVFARNYVFEGTAAEKKIRTKFEGKESRSNTRHMITRPQLFERWMALSIR